MSCSPALSFPFSFSLRALFSSGRVPALLPLKAMDPSSTKTGVSVSQSLTPTLEPAGTPLRTSKEDMEKTARDGMTRGGLPETEVGADRGGFQNDCQYILSCIGFAVGLGNIWRFPTRAYENGGGAFLLPYVVVALFFGLPTLYMECIIGQFTQSGPSVAFRHYAPIGQGIGWSMSVISISIALYYNAIIAWALIYIWTIITVNMQRWERCDSVWNSQWCDSSMLNKECSTIQADNVFFNGKCMSMARRNAEWTRQMGENTSIELTSAPEEFFYNYVLRKHDSFEFGAFNWPMALSLFVCWGLTCAGLVMGVKWLGRISLVTATTPYIIVLILFGRGVSLDHAWYGIKYYITPDFSKIFHYECWSGALAQLCFSLSIGLGGLLSMSSYNKRSHNAYRDAVCIVMADSAMSIIGGVAVFSTIGFMAHTLGKEVNQVVKSGPSLVFVAYPEAISHMPLPPIWAFLFFLMLFFLGISTMFGLVEGFVTCLCDQIPYLRTRSKYVVIATCVAGYLLGILFFCFQNGYNFFILFDDNLGSFALGIGILIEVLHITFVYGQRNFFRDVTAMFGRAKTTCGKYIGHSGLFIKVTACFTAPFFAVVLLIASLWKEVKSAMDYKGASWELAFGIVLGGFPILFIPIVAVYHVISFLRQGKSLRGLFQPTAEHPAVKYQLPHRPSLGEFFNPPIESYEDYQDCNALTPIAPAATENVGTPSKTAEAGTPA